MVAKWGIWRGTRAKGYDQTHGNIMTFVWVYQCELMALRTSLESVISQIKPVLTVCL